MVSSSLLRALGDSKSFLKGKMVHGKIIVSGFLSDVYSTNHLISMYVKCECLDYSRRVFDQMPQRNIFSWTILISGYSNTGHGEEALVCFRLMVNAGFKPNEFTYVSALSACASIGSARTGKEIHGNLYRIEQDLNSHLSNSLISLYAKCRMINSAKIVFDGIPKPGLVSWSSIISGYSQCGEDEEALRIFLLSRKEGVAVNEFTCATVLGACAGIGDLMSGRQIHCHVVKCGVGSDKFVGTGIISLYSKCGELERAQQSFSELEDSGLTSWVALIGGYAQEGDGKKAVDLFYKLHLTGFRPNERAFSSALPACEIEEGRQLHCLILKFGVKLVSFVGNALVDFYAKCGLLEDSMRIFFDLTERDVVTWNALIAGHVQWGQYGGAIKLFDNMLIERWCPNVYTYSSILSLCSNLPAFEWGKQTHGCVIKSGLDSAVVVGTTIIDMYAKCGRLKDARTVFDNLSIKNLVSWNSMLVGYAQHGFGKEGLEIFAAMQSEGIKPNDITFIGVLSACGHVGLVEDGTRYFKSMIRDHGIIPRIDHYSCMVDLYARGGHVGRAYEFIKNMPIEPDKVIWRSLLAACRNYKELDIGKCAAECILRLDPNDGSAYVMLWSLYAEAKMWDKVAKVRRIMKERGVKKEPGRSWVEVKNEVHCFIATDMAHSEGDIIRETVNGLTDQMVDAGYVPASISHEDE